MGRLDPSIPGYKLRQTGAEIQSILDAVSLLSGNEVKQLRELIDDIRDMDSTDNDDDLGAQLINGMVKKKDVQQTVNDNTTYPPTSGAVKSAIDTHKNKAELDHPQNSVKEHHLANNIVSSSKIKEGAVGKAKLSQDVKTMLDNAYDKVKLDSYISTLSKAPKYCLSDLNRHSSSEDFYFDLDNVVSGTDQYFILKNDTGYDFSASNPIWYNVDYGWYPDKSLLSGKTYLCIFRGFIDTGDGVIQNGTFDVVCEMGSDIIDLMTTSKGWNGTWKYGTELTHTDNTVQEVIEGTKAGDFYFNTHTYSVYYTHDGESWNYIGNLKGSINGDIWAKLDSPKFIGEPTAPTPTVTNNSTRIATTEYVRDAIDKYAGGDSGDGVSTDLIDNVENLVRDVYGTKQVATTASIKISSNFNLSFTCSSYNVGLSPSGTWSCTDISSLYNNILIDNQPLKHHPAIMDITDISVSDGYLENNYHEIIISINLDPNDIDAFPVGSLSGYRTNMIYSTPTENAYPRIYSANSNEIQVALGYITLPDTGVTVNGSEEILNVKAVNFGDVTIGAAEVPKDLNNLTTTYKTDLIGAINELVGKIDSKVSELRQELVLKGISSS